MVIFIKLKINETTNKNKRKENMKTENKTNKEKKKKTGPPPAGPSGPAGLNRSNGPAHPGPAAPYNPVSHPETLARSHSPLLPTIPFSHSSGSGSRRPCPRPHRPWRTIPSPPSVPLDLDRAPTLVPRCSPRRRCSPTPLVVSSIAHARCKPQPAPPRLDFSAPLLSIADSAPTSPPRRRRLPDPASSLYLLLYVVGVPVLLHNGSLEPRRPLVSTRM